MRDEVLAITNRTLFFIGFGISLVVYLVSPVVTPGDSRYNTHTVYSLLKNGDTNLNEFGIDGDDYRVQHVGDDSYNFFPVWTAILLIPSVLAADVLTEPVLTTFPELDTLIRSVAGDKVVLSKPIQPYELYPIHELITAAFISALCVGVLGLLARQHLTVSYTLLLMFIFAFTTPLWSTTSRALWMHGPSILMLFLTLFFLEKGRVDKRFVMYAGSTVALAYMFRPTNAIAVICVTSFVALVHRDSLFKFLLCALPFGVLFCGYNYIIYGQIISPYGSASRLYFHGGFGEALLGNWFSPARGLLIYCPLLFLSLVGFFDNRKNPIIILSLVVIVLHWLCISMFPHWWAGYSYGPRFFSDMLPFFGLGLIYFFELRPLASVFQKGIFSAVLVFSVFIHGNGALNINSSYWNKIPVSVDEHPERIWDWSDAQFLRIGATEETN